MTTMDTFYVGLTVGVIVGISLELIRNNLFKINSKNHSTHVNYGNQQELNSSSKVTGEYKIALLVRTDLKMGKGKVAAQCAVISIVAFKKGKLRGLPTKCPRIVLKVPDLKTLECIQKQCELFNINTATYTENYQATVLAIGPAHEVSIYVLLNTLKLY